MSTYRDHLDSHLSTTITPATSSPFLRTPNSLLNLTNRVEPPRDRTSVKVEGQNQHEVNDFLTELSHPWAACKAEEQSQREADSFSKALPRPGAADRAFKEESNGNQVRLSDVLRTHDGGFISELREVVVTDILGSFREPMLLEEYLLLFTHWISIRSASLIYYTISAY
jgi:hypothetical protein